MKQQIKVTDTRIHKVPKSHYEDGTPVAFKTTEILTVAEAKLVLVEVTEFWRFTNIKIGDKYYFPILISGTEKIEVGDCIYNRDHKMVCKVTIVRPDEIIVYEKDKYSGAFKPKDCFKVLALPEHFAPKHLQAIVDGKLKDGDKVLVECETSILIPRTITLGYDSLYSGFPEARREKAIEHSIKLNYSNHITLHQVEKRTYTKEDLEKAFNAGRLTYRSIRYGSYHPFRTFEEFLKEKKYSFDGDPVPVEDKFKLSSSS